MVERKVIVDKVSTFVGEKLNEVLDSNPFSFIIKPYVSRVANNYIGKLDGLLKAIEDKDGKVDIEGILSESIDNLVVAQVKKYPNVFSGVEIGGGTIKITKIVKKGEVSYLPGHVVVTKDMFPCANPNAYPVNTRQRVT